MLPSANSSFVDAHERLRAGCREEGSAEGSFGAEQRLWGEGEGEGEGEGKVGVR